MKFTALQYCLPEHNNARHLKYLHNHYQIQQSDNAEIEYSRTSNFLWVMPPDSFWCFVIDIFSLQKHVYSQIDRISLTTQLCEHPNFGLNTERGFQ